MPTTHADQLDVVAIGAHPDDVEIACGGTLAKLARQGRRVGIIDLTDGEPTPKSPGPHVRLAEAERAREVLGAEVRLQLGLPNRRLFDCFEARVAVAAPLRRYRPRIVLGLADKTALASPDHWQTNQIIDAAVHYAQRADMNEHFDGLPPHGVEAQLDVTLNYATLVDPTAAGHLIVDIYDTLDTKLAAVRCYETQFPPEKQHVLARIETLARYYGLAVGLVAGELIQCSRPLDAGGDLAAIFGLRTQRNA